jgi:mRNA-degrading endonuclease YafQ of YafQ-DinJ toxin-antitoxin module
MSSRIYTVSLKDSEVKVTDEQLSAFSSMYSISKKIRSRISELLWLDLYIYDQEFGVSPDDVLREIKNLESSEADPQTKHASQFSHKPLKGLWHKHFFSAHFVPHNISNALKGGVLQKLVNEELDPSKSPTITKGMIDDLSHRIIHEPIERRANDNKLTGEWIVFAKHNQNNYYLCCNTHDAGDQMIFDRINTHCQRDFPFLSALLASAKT